MSKKPFWVLALALIGISFAGPLVRLSNADPVVIAIWRLGFSLIVVFGFLIALVSSYLGFATSRGTEGVGEASTRSVVMASIAIILSDVLLVKLIFFFYPTVLG